MRPFFILSLSVALTSCAHKPPVEWEKVEKSLSTESASQVAAGAYAIMQGPTGPKTSYIVVMRPLEESLKYFVKSGDQVVSITPQSKDLMRSEFSMDYLTVDSSVSPSRDKNFKLFVFDELGKLRDQRQFGFLNPSKGKIKALVASCMNDNYKELQAEMWDQAFLNDPDVMLFIGDNVYADSGPEGRLKVNPKVLTRRYVETRLTLKAFRQAKLIPTFSVWDDHDFGQNNGGEDFKWKKQVSELFPQFFPQREIEGFYENGPGLSSKIKFKNFDVILFDNRSFRTSYTHFGKEQEDWFFNNLDSKKLNFLVSGDQWFGGYHQFESYQGNHPESFNRFLARLKKSKAEVIFISGDRHLSELMKIPLKFLGQKSFEITSSGIHATMYPGAFEKAPNPLQIMGVDGKVNYTVIEVPNQKRPSSILVKSLGQKRATLFEKRLGLDLVN